MQSKQNLTKQTTSEANEVVFKASLLLPDLNTDEIISVINEYNTDDTTTVCPKCEIELVDSDLAYVVDQQQTWGDPEEVHNACPHCDAELDCSDLQKPTFEHWLKLTA